MGAQKEPRSQGIRKNGKEGKEADASVIMTTSISWALTLYQELAVVGFAQKNVLKVLSAGLASGRCSINAVLFIR